MKYKVGTFMRFLTFFGSVYFLNGIYFSGFKVPCEVSQFTAYSVTGFALHPVPLSLFPFLELSVFRKTFRRSPEV